LPLFERYLMDMRRRFTRRDALRTGGGTVLAGLAAGIAGCGGVLSESDDGPTGRPDFVRWLPAPTEIETGDWDAPDHYGASFSDLSALRESDVLPLRENAVPSLLGPPAGVSMERVETAVLSDVAHVLTGTFDAEAVADELENGGTRGRGDRSEQYPAYSEESIYGEFTFYSSGEPVRVLRTTPVAVGVSDGAVVLAPGSGSVEARIDRLEAVIDAEAGDVDQYAEASEDFDRLVEKLGDGVGVSVRMHPEADETEPDSPGIGLTRRFEGQVAYGSVTRIEGGAESTFVKLFAEPDAVPVEELDTWLEDVNELESEGGRFREFSGSRSGRAWIMTARIDASAFSATPTPTEPGTPTDSA
jgi:hypothetical protein